MIVRGSLLLLAEEISWENVKINQHKDILTLFKFFYYTQTTMFVLAGQETIYVEEKYKNCTMLRFNSSIDLVLCQKLLFHVHNPQCQAVYICAGARFLLLGPQE